MIVAFTSQLIYSVGGYGLSPLQDRLRAGLKDVLENVGRHTCDCGKSYWGRLSDSCPCGEMRCGVVTYTQHVLTGMALGVDQWVAEACVELGIPFTAAVPFHNQDDAWPREAQVHYRELLSRAAEVHVVCPGPYAAWKRHRRNEWMVDRCGLLVAVWDGSTGGTKNCVDYARRVGREVWRIDPRALRLARKEEIS